MTRRPASCKWCGGRHITNPRCKGRRARLKLFGTVDAERQYHAPEGVAVRMMALPPGMDGETLARILKGLDSTNRPDID